jgi:2'-5' RNA ligase
VNEALRTFVAVPIPINIITRICEIQRECETLKFPIRWVRPEGIHLTLKFLGQISEVDTDRIFDAMTASFQEISSLSLCAQGMGVFPTIKRPKVIWVGIGGERDVLRYLQGKLEDNLAKIGFPKEKRAFNAHLTLGRMRGKLDIRKLSDIIRQFSDFSTDSFFVDEIILFKSDLKPSGAVYSKLRTVSLNRGSS